VSGASSPKQAPGLTARVFLGLAALPQPPSLILGRMRQITVLARRSAVRAVMAAESPESICGHWALDLVVNCQVHSQARPMPARCGVRPTEVRPDIAGGHRQVLGRGRIGQVQFRAELQRRFGNRSAISGEQPREILEAAHLYRYSETPHHYRRGGLLLRRDLHTLFDQRLLAIDTTSRTVRVAPRLLAYPSIADFHGCPLLMSTAARSR